MNLLQMSFAGAVLIFAVAGLRFFVLDKLPKSTFLVLWGFAAVRLLIPFSISSTFSVYSLFPGRETVRSAIAESPITRLLPINNIEQNIGTTAIASDGGIVFPVLGIVYVAGCILFGLAFLCAYLSCYTKVKAAKPISDQFMSDWMARHSTKRTVCIRECDGISSPLTYGVIKPVVLLPCSLDRSDYKQLNYVLLHEFIHIRRFDFLTKLLMVVVLCVHWFNPAVWLMYLLFNRDLELACDEAVIRRNGLKSRKDYALTLISLEEERSSALQICNGFSKSVSEERIRAIMKTKRITVFSSLSALILVCLLCTGFMTSAQGEEVNPNMQAMSAVSYSGKQTFQPTETSEQNGVSSPTQQEWVWPTESKEISLEFGTLSRPGAKDIFVDHINIDCNLNDEVYSAIAGTVTETGFDYEYGNYIIISGEDNTKTIYGHLSTISVSKDSIVSAGERIGFTGKTGMAVGLCLSFAVLVDDEAVDPLMYYE